MAPCSARFAWRAAGVHWNTARYAGTKRWVRGAELVGAQRRQWTRPVRLAALGILIVLAELVTKAFARTAVLSLDELTTQLAEVMLDQWQKAATDRRLMAPLPIHWRRSEFSVAGAAPTSSRGISCGGRPRSVVDPRNHRRDHRR